MKLGGLQETSLLDYPGKISAIVWTEGCNFRCPFCYNSDLVFGKVKEISVETLKDLLEKRKGKLDAVSITGGEPLLHEDIEDLIRLIKSRGYLVKVDTNGTFPTRLKTLLDKKLIDYVSMDVKGTKETYNIVAGVQVDLDSIESSIKLIQTHAPAYEFKTTVIPSYHTKKDIITIAQWLKGSTHYYLQQFKTNTRLLSKEAELVKPYSKETLLDICTDIQPFFKHCSIRGI